MARRCGSCPLFSRYVDKPEWGVCTLRKKRREVHEKYECIYFRNVGPIPQIIL
jgi:hypothetical protein